MNWKEKGPGGNIFKKKIAYTLAFLGSWDPLYYTGSDIIFLTILAIGNLK